MKKHIFVSLCNVVVVIFIVIAIIIDGNEIYSRIIIYCRGIPKDVTRIVKLITHNSTYHQMNE